MPELPEVHTTVTGLGGVLPGLIVRDFWSDTPKQIHNVSLAEFKKKVTGKKILNVSRMAKNVLIHLSGNITLRVHMKMTGQLLFDCPEAKYTHQRFYLSGGHELSFADMRKFGLVELIETKKIHEHKSLRSLGPEPIDESLTSTKLKEILMKRANTAIEPALMDQTLISGIGHIYADEILWHAGILPTRPVRTLKPSEFKAILTTARKILKMSISLGGDSMSDYRNAHGGKGHFQDFHKAYHQTGKTCQRRGCSGIIERVKLGGRNAHFCPKHQH